MIGSSLHYASRDGHFKTLQSLLNLGAVINLKNNDHQSPLHFAARYGRYNTVKHLLESPKGHLIINEMDGEGSMISLLHHYYIIIALYYYGSVSVKLQNDYNFLKYNKNIYNTHGV